MYYFYGSTIGYPPPKLSHTSMYYSRQLSYFNFGIHVTDTANGIMCVWHERKFWRRGNQIESCLMQAINSGHLTSYKRNLLDWYDNCAEQLKNKMLFSSTFSLLQMAHLKRLSIKFLYIRI